MNTLLAIFIGGGLGSLSRYGMGKLAAKLYDGQFPLGTFIANVCACLVMGVAVYYISKNQISDTWKSFLLIGFCGGFSTFSTFSYETLDLMKQGLYGWVVLNVLLSVGVCVLLLGFLAKNT